MNADKLRFRTKNLSASICVHRRLKQRGGALLATLWLVAGLSAIAFTVATTVRGETERTSTNVDSARTYYLAAGAIERTILYMQWGPQHNGEGDTPRYHAPWMSVLRMPFPTGEAEVEIIPETAKFNVNLIEPKDLLTLLLALGASPERASAVTEAILDWRAPGPNAAQFNQYYLSLTPSFLPRRASVEEIEELLAVRGMTPELFHGTYIADAQGRLHPRGGLRDCITVFGDNSRFDVNSAHPAVLAALGFAPQAITAIVDRRRRAPFRNEGDIQNFGGAAGQPVTRLRVGGNSMFTIRATARIRLDNGQLGDLRRSVAAMVKFMPPGYDAQYHIMRWYDNAWRN